MARFSFKARSGRRGVALVGAIAAFLMAAAAPALAASMSGSFTSSWGPTGARFDNGTWRFAPWPCNGSAQCVSGHSGWNYSGYLRDTAAEGDWVYTQGRIDGYGWASKFEYHGGVAGGGTTAAQKIYSADPAQEGRMQVCRNRDGVLPNDCKQSGWKYRP
ncbi:hypothetical protein ACFJIY_12525 [Pimelobacter simplex]|uniref:hypothetical protein n=1 Tax=Nocardioides simplex TaxID=2045 RepID=UPI00366FCC76